MQRINIRTLLVVLLTVVLAVAAKDSPKPTVQMRNAVQRRPSAGETNGLPSRNAKEHITASTSGSKGTTKTTTSPSTGIPETIDPDDLDEKTYWRGSGNGNGWNGNGWGNGNGCGNGWRRDASASWRYGGWRGGGWRGGRGWNGGNGWNDGDGCDGDPSAASRKTVTFLSCWVCLALLSGLFWL